MWHKWNHEVVECSLRVSPACLVNPLKNKSKSTSLCNTHSVRSGVKHHHPPPPPSPNVRDKILRGNFSTQLRSQSPWHLLSSNYKFLYFTVEGSNFIKYNNATCFGLLYRIQPWVNIIYKSQVRSIKMCGNLRVLVNCTTIITLDYFVDYLVHLLNRGPLHLNV
jgi:hypothetical protein